jgi:DNA polymerase-3 subunit gamma/tau
MQLADESARGAARRASRLACLWAVVIAGLGIGACAGPSAKVQVAAADANQAATADTDADAQAAASESAAAAAEEQQPDSTDATASANAPPPVETADGSAPPTPSTPPEEPQATTDPATTDTPPMAAAQPEPSQSATSAGDVPPPGSGLATGRPYVVIRFTESSVDYEKALSEAVKRAVARRPNLAFDLVAVTPRAGTAEELADLTEQAHAEAAAVMKSLNELGIGPERVSMMTWTGQPTDVNEIRLYIR